MNMFCYQCEQVKQGGSCDISGVCGKSPETAKVQDLLIYCLKGLSMYSHRSAQMGVSNEEIDKFTIEVLFTTVTNVNFDAERQINMVYELSEYRNKARNIYEKLCFDRGIVPEKLTGPANFVPSTDKSALMTQADEIGIDNRIKANVDITSLEETILYGLKGAAAYADHALILGVSSKESLASFHEVLNFLSTNHELNDYVAMALRVGEINLKVMELLDNANTNKYGHPEPTSVKVTNKIGKAILISGHDLKDLEELLIQTEGKGINVYTHSEMLPANSYPGLKKYKHLAGNYGGAWQDQHQEFANFPGPIVMTTNCLQKPLDSYKDRIYTMNLVGWPGIKHIVNRNYSEVIEKALSMDGFVTEGEDKNITIGFGHNTVMSVANLVIDAVKEGKIRHFFLIGGCDGAKSGRNYYTEFAEKVPKDCVILTLACGKYRFNKMEFGDIGGIPRLLDIGQCNDAYSAIQIAVALAKAFDTDVNSLPLSMILSWFEQKAVAILLTLLHLGIKNIHIGPSLPAFISPNVLNVLVENYNLKPISTPEKDLNAILNPIIS